MFTPGSILPALVRAVVEIRNSKVRLTHLALILRLHSRDEGAHFDLGQSLDLGIRHTLPSHDLGRADHWMPLVSTLQYAQTGPKLKQN